MKRIVHLIAIAIISFIIYWNYSNLTPQYSANETIPKTVFSTDRAFAHIEAISKKPHSVGFPAHQEVRKYLVQELKKLGLTTQLQEGYTAGDWGNFSKVTNIIAKIEGTTNGKALLLLSHYDSNPHSSFGASDAGSGVATILEAVRAFLAKNQNPKNDIIILFSDAEELGLNGAELFVNKHPLAKEIGLVLNFEARGSGGPSYMLLETNGGNAKLIKEFMTANPEYPVANSLMYSIYKMLPNDTDLTVFREQGDIDGFNFAFIDDHFDYHTALDTSERLDKKTLAHQGSYISPLLSYFSNANLSDTKSEKDDVYFSIPILKFISYPFSWIFPMLIIGILGFIALLYYGIKKKKTLDVKEIVKGFIPFTFGLLITGVIGYFSWPLLKWFYPQYQDILQGFPYNGHSYIAAFVFLSLASLFFIYKRFKNYNPANLLIAPLFFWIIISTLVAVYLKGASFFIIPVFFMLISLFIFIRQKNPSVALQLLLCLTALLLYTPLVIMFPIGLGLKMLIAATLFTTLTFGLLLPIIGLLRSKRTLGFISLTIAFVCFISAHINRGATINTPKPNSLVYVQNNDTNKAYWATYDNVIGDWNKNYIDSEKNVKTDSKVISNKYGAEFTYLNEAPQKSIAGPTIEKLNDTIINGKRIMEICISSHRDINRLDFYSATKISSATINDIALSSDFLKNRRERLVTHHVSDNEFTVLKLTFPKTDVLELTLYEASNDLLTHPKFSIAPRPETNIPMPFILNDAILIKKTITFE